MTYLLIVKQLAKSLIRQVGLVLFTTYIFIKANDNGSLRVSLHDIPHLRLSKGVMAGFGQSIIGVYLYGKILSCIDELDEQREVCSKSLIYRTT